MKRNLTQWLLEHIFGLALFAAVAAILLAGLSNASRSSTAEELRIAEDGVRRAVVSCYAIEGVYPESYEYLRDNYGVRVDESRFRVMYDIFAENIMPDITILEVTP